MRIYRKHAVLKLSIIDEREITIIEIAPAYGGAIQGLKAESEHFNYNEAIRIGLNSLEMLKASYKLLGIASGLVGDSGLNSTITIATSSSKAGKTLVAMSDGEDVDLTLTHSKKTYSVKLAKDEVHAIGMWFQFQAQYLLCFASKSVWPENAPWGCK